VRRADARIRLARDPAEPHERDFHRPAGQLMDLPSIANGIDRLNRRFGEAVAWLTLGMVLITVVDVIMRYLFNTGAVWVQELEWHLFGMVFLLAGGYALLHDAHVRVDIFYAHQSPRVRAWIDLMGTVLFLFPVCALVLWSSQKFVLNSWGFQEGSPDPGGLPARYLIKGVIPLGFALIALQGVSELIKNALRVMHEKEPS
jgi:TRAP-type mannitol/chloroaromatic compound transport system permease small subunit